MENAAQNRQDHAGSGWTTTAAAAKALGIAQRTVRLYINQGVLKGKLDEGTDKKKWLVSIDSINDLIATRGISGIIPEEDPEIAASVPEAMRDLAIRLESRTAEAAEYKTRLELTEKAQSTLEENLKRAEEEAERYRQALEAEKAKTFWQRLFSR